MPFYSLLYVLEFLIVKVDTILCHLEDLLRRIYVGIDCIQQCHTGDIIKQYLYRIGKTKGIYLSYASAVDKRKYISTIVFAEMINLKMFQQKVLVFKFM